MKKMKIKDEFKGKTVIIYNSVLGNQNIVIDKILPKHYDWYCKNGLKHIFEAEETVEEIVEETVEEIVEEVVKEVTVPKKTRTKKK
jgi:galactose-1-phosphate uridylyltransferase